MKIHEIFETLNTILPYTKGIKNGMYEFIITVKSNVTITLLFSPYKNGAYQMIFFITGKYDFELADQFSSKEALQIFSTISKICKTEKDNFKIVYFTAKLSDNPNAKELEKRTSLYTNLALRFCKENRWYLNKKELDGDIIFIASKEKLDGTSNRTI